MKEIRNSPPLIITDTNGKILTITEAAHNICAALSPGGNITDHLSADAAQRYRVLLSEGSLSFVLSDALGCDSVFFDLTKERTEGVRSIYLSGSQMKIEEEVDYLRVAEAFASLSEHEGFLGKRRFTELYDTLVSGGGFFGSHRKRELFPARMLTESFFSDILPRLLYVSGDVVFTPDASYDEASVIFAEPYGFYLLLCAVISAASHVAKGHVHVSARDTGDKVTYAVTATLADTAAKRYERAADFGVRALDVLYAEALARVSGYSFSFESLSGRVSFTVSVNSHDYYPTYLKTDAVVRFIIASVSESIRYPMSAEEEEDKEQ